MEPLWEAEVILAYRYAGKVPVHIMYFTNIGLSVNSSRESDNLGIALDKMLFSKPKIYFSYFFMKIYVASIHCNGP